MEVRLVLYAIAVILNAVLAYNFIMINQTLARWLGVLLLANAVNAGVFFLTLIYKYVTGSSMGDVGNIAWTVNAFLLAFIPGALLVAFYRVTRGENNGDGSELAE